MISDGLLNVSSITTELPFTFIPTPATGIPSPRARSAWPLPHTRRGRAVGSVLSSSSIEANRLTQCRLLASSCRRSSSGPGYRGKKQFPRIALFIGLAAVSAMCFFWVWRSLAWPWPRPQPAPGASSRHRRHTPHRGAASGAATPARRAVRRPGAAAARFP